MDTLLYFVMMCTCNYISMYHLLCLYILLLFFKIFYDLEVKLFVLTEMKYENSRCRRILVSAVIVVQHSIINKHFCAISYDNSD